MSEYDEELKKQHDAFRDAGGKAEEASQHFTDEELGRVKKMEEGKPPAQMVRNVSYWAQIEEIRRRRRGDD